MEETTQREKVLKRLRNALIHKANNPFPDIDFESSVYHEMVDPLEIIFAEALIAAGGNFVYCESEQEFIENMNILMKENQWYNVMCAEEHAQQVLETGHIPFMSDVNDIVEAEVALTQCEALIARLGSVMVSSRQLCGRRMFVYPPVHIVLAYTSQLVPDLKDAFKLMKTNYGDKIPSMISVITGPSRTADIESTIVMGAHGPKDVYVFLIEDMINE